MRLVERDVEQLFEVIGYNGSTFHVATAHGMATSWREVQLLPAPVLRDMTIVNHDSGLMVSVSPTEFHVMCVDEPDAATREALDAVIELLNSRRRWVSGVRSNLMICGPLALIAIIVVGVVQMMGYRTTQSWTAVIGAQLFTVPFLLNITGRFPIDPPPIILRQAEWESGGLLERWGGDIGLVLTLGGALLAAVAYFF